MMFLMRTYTKIKVSVMMQPRRMYAKAVIFDMGGVLIPSPGKLFTDFECKLGVPRGTLLKTIMASQDDSAWSKLERGELTFSSFSEKFNSECLKETGITVDTKDLLSDIVTFYADKEPFPVMISAIKKLRSCGLKTALLTNNFYLSDHKTHLPIDCSLFDVIVESARVKMRKPEHRIYEKVLKDLQVLPSQAVFLDDLGHNLKTAKNMGIHTIKVENPLQAVMELENYLSLKLSDYDENTREVPEGLMIDIVRLEEYLKAKLGLNSSVKPTLRCFQQGQSNPTYLVNYAGESLVLRKKPPGVLLQTAHAIEREFKIMEALGSTNVPVPKMISFCSDDSILGTPFYLMEYVRGVVLKDAALPGLLPDQKKKVMDTLCEVLHKIHKIDFKKLGLENLGSKGSFVARNLARWWKQYESSKCESGLRSMASMHKWLEDHLPSNEKTTLIHGDYRLDNLIFDPETYEARAVIDWELATLGDPMTDLANSCLSYLAPNNPILTTVDMNSVEARGIPSLDEYLKYYFSLDSTGQLPENWDFYLVFVHFRISSILQGIYKRFLNNQASSSNAHIMFKVAQEVSDSGWAIAQNSKLPPTKSNVNEKINGSSQLQLGLLATCVEALDERAKTTVYKVKQFIDKYVMPIEEDLVLWHSNPETKWKIHPRIEELKDLAKSQGLWNLFVPIEIDPQNKFGKGFSNVEYSFMAEEMGRSPFASELFNCSAPDTGNMEVLIRYGNDEQKAKWLVPLLDGRTRSCFAMTEPGVASSDATNIRASIRKEGKEYVVNGHKWWTSGALDPRCSFSIFMGKTDEHEKLHQQQSMLIIPLDLPGVKIVRPLHVFGFDDAPHGHAEVLFENVKVPESNLILGEGRGFEIAQGRLGPGRIHHCMRTIGSLERCLQLMLERTQKRIAFGKHLIEHGIIKKDVAEARIQIEQARLLVLKAAHVMDVSGNKAAALEIAMIKAVVPEIGCKIIDRAIQAFGGMGVCQDVILSRMYTMARCLCIADGPTEVHLRSIANMEIKKFNSKI